MNPDPLSQLRDYHLPDPVDWWPPAPGWWVLTILIIAVLSALVHWLWKQHRGRAALRQARRELLQLRTEHTRNADDAALLRGLSRLLRRFALARFPREQVAGLSGEAWLAFLDQYGVGDTFSKGPGRILLDAPYRRDSQVNGTMLLDLVQAWIQRNPEYLG